MEIWKPNRIEPETLLHARIGPLALWLRRVGEELHIAAKRLDAEEPEQAARQLAQVEGAPPDDLDWGRWIVGEQAGTVQLVPVTPDRPVVVRPESPVKVPPNRQALFFVSIPLWVRVVAGEAEKVTLCEEPCVVLSNIWFGDPMSGELCYSLRTRARSRVADSEARPHLAICPVRIHNKAAAQLDVQRFCVRVEHLRVYDGAAQPWTNEVSVTFRGEDEASQLDYAQEPPAFEPVGGLLSDARSPLKKGLLKKTVGGLRHFTGI